MPPQGGGDPARMTDCPRPGDAFVYEPSADGHRRLHVWSDPDIHGMMTRMVGEVRVVAMLTVISVVPDVARAQAQAQAQARAQALGLDPDDDRDPHPVSDMVALVIIVPGGTGPILGWISCHRFARGSMTRLSP